MSQEQPNHNPSRSQLCFNYLKKQRLSQMLLQPDDGFFKPKALAFKQDRANEDGLQPRKVYEEEAVKLGLDPDFLFKRRHKRTDDKELKAKIMPSLPAPKTMSQFVGWRSALEHSLEICGPLYVSPKQELKKEEVKSYHTIFLG